MAKTKAKRNPQFTSISANVFLHNQLVGQIVHHRTRGFFFEYDSSFRTRGIEISPLKLPLKPGVTKIPAALERISCFSGLPGVFADSLPDKFGNELLSKHFQERGFDPQTISPIQKLLYVGSTGMGALEYRPMERVAEPSILPLEIRTLVEQARNVIRGELKSAMPELMLIGTSAGGARAKGLIGWDRKTNEIVAGIRSLPKKYEHWIIKFDGTQTAAKGWGKIEYTYAEMARRAGIKFSETHLLEESGRSHFMTRRFDRNDGNKIHMHSLCGMVEVDFNEHRLFDYVSFAREVLHITKSYADMEQVYRRAIFNLLSRNQDDHLKNFAFLMNEKGIWNLAPAYDLCYSVGGWCSENQMTFDGILGQKVTLRHLLNIGAKLGVKNPNEIIGQIDSSLSAWTTLAKRHNVTSEQIVAIQKAYDERRKSVGIKSSILFKTSSSKAFAR